MRARTRVAVAAGAAVLFFTPTSAWAGEAHDGGGAVLSDPIAQGLAGPLQLAVGERGDVYVAQDFAGLLTRIDRRGGQSVIATNEGGEIAGVDVEDGRVLYTTTNGDPQAGTTTATALKRVERDGSSSVVADLLAYERSANPDQVNTYGFESIPAACAAQLPPEIGPPRYTGQIDSHPYAVAIDDGHRYIADAAGNTILDVSRRGKVRTVAVLPPQPSTITAAGAASTGLPACAVGLTYDFEPVPTDVEVGHDGMLYVTTLPGGPEDPSLGARGSVYRVNPWNGQVRRIATGFLGATNLAIGPRGTIYASELFAGRISRVGRGGPETVVELASPAGLEYADGKLYVGYDVFANGSVATIRVGW